MRRFLNRRNLIIATILVVAVGGWWWRRSVARRQAGEERRVVEVQRKDVVLTLTAPGKVRAEKEAVLNFPSPGKLGFVRVEEGDEVKKGEWLMGLDMGDLKAAETKAFYAYLAADANAKEAEDDVKGHDSDETFEQKNQRVAAQTARDSAYESWVVAQRAVSNAVLKAPFDGIVTVVTTTAVGDTVGVTDGVTVVDPGGLYFETEVDEAEVAKVTLGQAVGLELDAFEDEEFSGELAGIGFVAGVSSTGATVFPVKVMFGGEVGEGRLRLGMNGDARFELARANQVLVLPIEAVIDGKVERESGEMVEVETGLEGDVEVEIKAGLKEGERVVVR